MLDFLNVSWILYFADLDLLTMQTFIDKNNNEYVEDVSFDELTRRAVNITANAKFNRRMKDFKLRRDIWRKSILSLLMKIRHLNRYSNLVNCFHQMFELRISIIDFEIDFLVIFNISINLSTNLFINLECRSL
jgi:hypothetical protein